MCDLNRECINLSTTAGSTYMVSFKNSSLIVAWKAGENKKAFPPSSQQSLAPANHRDLKVIVIIPSKGRNKLFSKTWEYIFHRMLSDSELGLPVTLPFVGI